MKYRSAWGGMKFAMDWSPCNGSVPCFFNSVLKETQKAVQLSLRLKGGSEIDKWLPKKYIRFDEEHKDTVWIAEWLFNKINETL